MNDYKIIHEILNKIGIDRVNIDDYIEAYNLGPKIFLDKVISLSKNKRLFIDFYLKNIPFLKLTKIYMRNRFEIRDILNQVIDIDLYLTLSKCILKFEDPLYDYVEFDQLLLDTIGLRYESIRLNLIKKYDLIERSKNGITYIIPRSTFKQSNVKNEEKIYNLVDEILKMVSTLDNIEINDVLKMKKYVEDSGVNINTSDFEKVYEYIEKNLFEINNNLYISKEKAMVSREWSLAKVNKNINVDLKGINIRLYNSIKNKELRNEMKI